jgi:hypothetical protein
MVFTSVCLLCLKDKPVSTVVSAEPKYSHILLTFRLFDIHMPPNSATRVYRRGSMASGPFPNTALSYCIPSSRYVRRSGKSWSLVILISCSWTPSLCGPFSLPECMNPEAYLNPLPLDACTDLDLRCPAGAPQNHLLDSGWPYRRSLLSTEPTARYTSSVVNGLSYDVRQAYLISAIWERFSGGGILCV